jgi:NAD(P)-dependent dehydrogenase (short-subunit alcohol dehydrogenase family)
VLAGKVIVVIGGTSGLGLSAAKAMIAAGARVVAVGRDDEYLAPAIAAVGAGGIVYEDDAESRGTATRAIARAVSELGRCDGLYHVAGGSGRRVGDGPLHEITDEGWHRTIDLNLTSLFLSNRAAVSHFLAAKTPGVVLNVASVLAFRPAPAHFATHAYAAAKAAAIGFTTSCAAYYAPHGVRFNAIAPGLVQTPSAARAANDERIRAYVARRQPLDGGRVGQPEDLDAAVVYLLSDAARFVTGQVLAVDGGWSVSEGLSAP